MIESGGIKRTLNCTEKVDGAISARIGGPGQVAKCERVKLDAPEVEDADLGVFSVDWPRRSKVVFD